jgi:ribosomal protein S18 acetylase RimI-like enzyme
VTAGVTAGVAAGPLVRRATAADAGAVADLHADSWQRTYRGIYADDYLAGPVVDELRRMWADRLAHPGPGDVTTLALRGERLVGFVHTIVDEDPTWGALLDNLHVAGDTQGTGVGTLLMAESARVVVDRAPGSGLYLWVLERNARARAFYAARGGERGVAVEVDAPGGGRIVAVRYAWPDPATLLPPP